MTASTPVERVAARLEAARFKRMTTPFTVAGLEFAAPAAFVGEAPAPDLVVVGDTTRQTVRMLQQIVEGVGRALDTVRSRRPVTLVLVGPRPDSAALGVLSRYARVLPIGEIVDDATLNNWLAVLLPLNLPVAASRGGIETLSSLRTGTDALATRFIDLANISSDAVADQLYALVDEPFLEDDIEDDV